ncbi:hypothetical protein GJAV_G00094950 [Gymnothorax javanicus]|nr:hypothetical protein GJAV_G00094950 [Gymnothorax javanicus]
MPLGFGVVLFSVFILIDAERTLTQRDLYLTKRVGNTVFIRCEASGLSSGDYVHWYQKKDEEPFRRLLYISNADGSKILDSTLAKDEKDSFSTEKTPSRFDLKIQNLQKAHAAIYYCACWDAHSDNDAINCCAET